MSCPCMIVLAAVQKRVRSYETVCTTVHDVNSTIVHIRFKRLPYDQYASILVARDYTLAQTLAKGIRILIIHTSSESFRGKIFSVHKNRM